MSKDMSDSNDNKHLLVIKASAGSGKTYNLALQYIKHLLFDTSFSPMVPRRPDGGDRVVNAHRQLLAITFTNKATNEMKERIVNELHKLAQPGVKSDYLQQFMDESGLPEVRVRELARLALNELLFDYSNFNVSTIDSFFQGVLRNFARELDRDFNYDIQLEEDYAVSVAVHNFLLSLGRDKQPQVDKWVSEHQRHLLRSDAKNKKWKFFEDGGDMFSVAKQLKMEIFRSRMEDIRKYLGKTDADGRYTSDFSKINRFKQLLQGKIQQLKSDIDKDLQTLRDELAKVYDDLSGSKSFKKWYDKVELVGELAPLGDSLKGADENKIIDQFYSRTPPSQDLVDRLLPLVTRHFKMRLQVPFYQHIEDYLGLLGLLAMIDHYLEEYRHESNSILIGDTNDLIGVVLESGSDFVFERVGTIIKHFMIDEFQDTSAKQYSNFSSLLGESLSSGNFNMLIGDAKQSIYRFRNADLTVFRKRVGDDFGGYIYEPEVSPGGPRSRNFRSSRKIIEFNNDLFAYVREQYGSANDVVRVTYEDAEQGMSPNIDEKKVPGYVRILTGNYQQLLLDPVIAAAVSQQTAPVTAESETVEVTDVLPGYLLKLHERYQWGQIGILVNTHAQGNQLVEAILDYNKRTTGKRISVISGESLLLSNSPIIRRIIAMLRFIDVSRLGSDNDDDPDADEPQDRLQRSILKKRLSDQRMYAALNDFIHHVTAHPDETPAETGEALARCLEGRPLVALGSQGEDQQNYDALLARLLPADSELTTLVSIVETIIGHFKDNADSGNDIDRETAFLMSFQDCVMHFASQRNGGSVREFLKYWDENKQKLAVSLPSTTDAVNIMTIHAAKGLEFDCVLIPYAEWELADKKRETDYWMPGECLLKIEDAINCDVTDVPPLLHVNKKTLVELDSVNMLREDALDFLVKQRTDLLVDNLNKTYVAFTRPCTEMHVFTAKSGKSIVKKDEDQNTDGKKKRRSSSTAAAGGPAKDLTDLLRAYCAGHGTPDPDVKEWYEWGEKSTRDEIRAKMKKKDEDEGRPEQKPLNQYTIRPISLSINVKVDNIDNPYAQAGKRLHSLLSRIRDCNDLDRVVDEGLKRGIITREPGDRCGLDSVEKHVCQPMRNPASRVAAWFDPANKVYDERTISSPMSEERKKELEKKGKLVDDVIDNLRPDRIVRRPDGQLLVIDYKSGKRDDQEHCEQVQSYIDKLRLIYPGTPIAGRIWYVLRDDIIDEQGHKLPNLLG